VFGGEKTKRKTKNNHNTHHQQTNTNNNPPGGRGGGGEGGGDGAENLPQPIGDSHLRAGLARRRPQRSRRPWRLRDCLHRQRPRRWRRGCPASARQDTRAVCCPRRLDRAAAGRTARSARRARGGKPRRRRGRRHTSPSIASRDPSVAAPREQLGGEHRSCRPRARRPPPLGQGRGAELLSEERRTESRPSGSLVASPRRGRCATPAVRLPAPQTAAWTAS